MAERLSAPAQTPSGISRSGLKKWALVFLVLGTAGYALVQNGLLKIQEGDLLSKLEDSRNMGYAALAILLWAVHCCATPLYAFFLVEGARRTQNFGRYFLRVGAVALASELPYNLAFYGTWWDLSSRSPAVGAVLVLCLMYFYRRFGGKGFRNVLMKVLVTACAVFWAGILEIRDGGPLVVLAAVLWALWEKPALRTLFGAVAGFACSLFSPAYMLSPMVFIFLHFYNGEKGEENPWVYYLSYPLLLLAFGLTAVYIL